MQSCDNVSETHDAIIFREDDNAIAWYCKICGHDGIIRKDERGIPRKEEFQEVFRRWALQGNDPLFYKAYPRHLRV